MHRWRPGRRRIGVRSASSPAAGSSHGVGWSLPQVGSAAYISRLPSRSLKAELNGRNPDSRCAHPQPAQHRPRPAPRPPDRDHGAVGLGQVIARVRHDLRRRSASLRRVALRLRTPVPLRDGEAGRRPHRGPVPRHRHRTEGDVAQPALDRRHRHRNLRLPARAVRARRRAALPGARPGPGRADRHADGRPRARAAGRHGRAAARADRAGPQGRTHRGVRSPAQPGLRARAHRRQARRTRRQAGTRWPATPHDRSGHRPPQGASRRVAATGRIVRDGPRPGAGFGASRLPRRARARAARVLEPLRLHGVRLQPHGTRAAALLVQQPERRLRHVRWPGRAGVLRSGARGGQSEPLAGGRGGARLGPSQRVLLPADPVARQALSLRHRSAVERPARSRAPRAALGQRRGEDPVPLRRCEGRRHEALARVGRHPAEPRAALPRDRVDDGARGTREVPWRARVRGLRWQPAQPGSTARVRGGPRVARDRRDVDRRSAAFFQRDAHRGLARRNRLAPRP